jgi:hypothetical protein
MDNRNQTLKGVSIIIFEKDAGIDLGKTLESLNSTLKEFSNLKYELITVDDGSFKKPNESEIAQLNSKFIALEANIGISGAIKIGTREAKYSMTLPVPGTNMYSPEAYRNIFRNINSHYDFILGYRSNLRKERPLAKFLASKLLLYVFQISTSHYNIKDIHGLNCFNTNDILRYLPDSGKHGGQLMLLSRVMSRKINFIEVSAPILEGHKNRASASKKDSFPRIHSIFDVLYNLIQIILKK